MTDAIYPEEETRRELEQIVSAHADGKATVASMGRLAELLGASQQNRDYYSDLIGVQVMLMLAMRGGSEGDIDRPQEACEIEALLTEAASHTDVLPDQRVEPFGHGGAAPHSHAFGRWQAWMLCAAAAAGLLVGVYWGQAFRGAGGTTDLRVSVAPRGSDDQASSSPSVGLPVATLISNTNSIWSADSGMPIRSGSTLRPGHAVTLFDGHAEMRFSQGVSVFLKGPTLLSIGADGKPCLKYGRLIVSNREGGDFLVATSPAVVNIPTGSYVGLDAFGDDLLVDSLEGGAQLIPYHADWDTFVAEGLGVSLGTDQSSQIVLTKRSANPGPYGFGSRSVNDALPINDAYAELVLSSSPIAYWRFEDRDSPTVINEAGDTHSLRIRGDGVRLENINGNGFVEFEHRGTSAGSLVATDCFDELIESSYSVELWCRPRYHHSGALVSLFSKQAQGSTVSELPSILIELTSDSPIPNPNNKSVRFLHRSPPEWTASGASCYSSSPYYPRTWQHIAAVRDGESLRLFVDGQLVSEEQDSQDTTGELSLVVGQLLSFGSLRPYVGLLDELAIYNRALTAQEVIQRTDAVRR